MGGPSYTTYPPDLPLPTDLALAPSIAVGQLAVTDSAALVVDAPVAGHFRFGLTMTNLDTANTIFIGPDSSVSSTTGGAILPLQTLKLDRSYGAVYAATAATKTAILAFISEGR